MSPSLRTHAPALLARAVLLAVPLFLSACSDSPAAPVESRLGALELLGERVFEDSTMSLRKNQSCASCHAAEFGFRGSSDVQQGGVFEGSVAGRFGSRVPGSAAYATFAPVFGTSAAGEVGGNFWDGRATGAELGSAAAEQARGPFVNPDEQALPDVACVVYRVSVSSYADLYADAWDSELGGIEFPADADAQCATEGVTLALTPDDRERVRVAYDRIAQSIAAFEASPRVSSFSSKFDAWLQGRATFTHQEQMGFMLFQGPGRCAVCHTVGGRNPLFTDFRYHNVGTPANPDNPAQADAAFVDLGLGGASGAAPGEAGWGRVRTPTLRNVDLRPTPGAEKRFMHNGAFMSLKEVVAYYNTRDVLPRCEPDAPRTDWGVSCWPAPAVGANLNTTDMGNLGLNAFQEDAIVAFLRTLSDGYMR